MDSNKTTILIIRVVLGVVGGLALWHFFLRPSNPLIVVPILAGIVVLAAYTSEWWRTRKK